MCDDFLQTLQLLPLKRLVVHVHGLDEEHPGVSEGAWASFRAKNPQAELHLTLVCAYEAVDMLHSHILRPSMPLSNLKVLFCERVRKELNSRCRYIGERLLFNRSIVTPWSTSLVITRKL